jgi:iron complex outermembrane receptor protein
MSTTRLRNMLLTGATAMVAMTALPGLAAAQSAPASQAEDGAQLEDIVVTADKTGTESVQVGSFRGAKQLDTPLAISVIPRALLDTQQASTTADVLKNTPGVTLSQTSPTVYSNVAIRGILTENRTNYRMDGVLPVINLIDMGLEDKERIEALKGASAIYYGFSPPSGIINMVMKRPTQDPLLAVKVFGNTFGRAGVHVDFGGTRGIFGYRINAVYDEPNSGIDYTSGRRTLISGAFDIKPTDNLTVQINAEHLFKKVNEPGIWRLNPPSASAPGNRAYLLPTQNNPRPTIPLPPLLDPTTNFGPNWASNRAEESNFMTKVIWKFAPAWELNVSGGFSRLQRDRHFNNLDWTQQNTNPLRGTVGEYLMTQIQSQIGAKVANENYRAELAGTFDTGPIRHELLIGATALFRENINAPNVAINCLYSTVAATNGQLVGTYVAAAGTAPPAGTVAGTCTQNPFNPHAIPAPLVDSAASVSAIAKFHDVGFYAFDRIKFTDWLSVIAGVRYTDYHQYTDVRIKSGYYSAKPVSFSGGIIIKPIESISLYGTYLEGLEATPSGGTLAINPDETFAPSKSTQYEAGFKWEIKRGLLFQSALFQIERDLYALDATNRFGLQGRSRYRGIEISLNGNITPDWSVYSSALFLDAKAKGGTPTVVSTIKSPDGSFYITPTLDGNRIENTARRTFNISTSYDLNKFVHGFSLNGGMFYTGNQAINNQNQNFIPAVTTFDLGAAMRVEVAETPVVFRVNVENVANKWYFISTGSNVIAQAPPRTIKLSAEVKF